MNIIFEKEVGVEDNGENTFLPNCEWLSYKGNFDGKFFCPKLKKLELCCGIILEGKFSLSRLQVFKCYKMKIATLDLKNMATLHIEKSIFGLFRVGKCHEIEIKESGFDRIEVANCQHFIIHQSHINSVYLEKVTGPTFFESSIECLIGLCERVIFVKSTCDTAFLCKKIEYCLCECSKFKNFQIDYVESFSSFDSFFENLLIFDSFELNIDMTQYETINCVSENEIIFNRYLLNIKYLIE